ncbi:hypothetical protein G4G27_15755 [Sphingomonas sp. So64.6b]|uniref:hypothetical protein n=1 Tax=Sphingomonas sp. So64.6b TaxID=2997354 RepID=UPI0015FF5FEC|nr:hypothetical protein [Sphingomonas sp. So64.6b]QNA85287.1 hypothetical protein G4G27_15755 [Sphingomonas sp. So64.6b]
MDSIRFEVAAHFGAVEVIKFLQLREVLRVKAFFGFSAGSYGKNYAKNRCGITGNLRGAYGKIGTWRGGNHGCSLSVLLDSNGPSNGLSLLVRDMARRRTGMKRPKSDVNRAEYVVDDEELGIARPHGRYGKPPVERRFRRGKRANPGQVAKSTRRRIPMGSISALNDGGNPADRGGLPPVNSPLGTAY